MARRPALNQPDKPRQPARQHEAPMLPPGVVPSRYGGLLDQRHIDRPVDLPERGPAAAVASEPQRDSVDADTLIKRPDLGPTHGRSWPLASRSRSDSRTTTASPRDRSPGSGTT